MSRSSMPWLFVACLLAAGIVFLVTGLRSEQAGDFNINLLAAGVDFAVTSLVTALVVERFRALRMARDQSRLYGVVSGRLATATREWAAALTADAGRAAPEPAAGTARRTTVGAGASPDRPALTEAVEAATAALGSVSFDRLAPDARAAVAGHSTRLLQRFADCLELLYAATPSPALLEAVDDLRQAQHRWSVHRVGRDGAAELTAETTSTIQAVQAAGPP